MEGKRKNSKVNRFFREILKLGGGTDIFEFFYMGMRVLMT
jgi:hypothetical protein